MKSVLYTKLLEELETVKDKDIVFWGASLFLKDFIRENNLSRYNILGIIDKNEEKWGQKIEGYSVFAPAILEQKPDITLLFSIMNNNEYVYHSLKKFLKLKYPQIRLSANIFAGCTNNEDLIQVLKDNHAESMKQYREILNGQIFNNLIQNALWVQNKDFIPTGGAATYSFLLILFIILERVRPVNILEFGMGQTSKLTASYAANLNKSSKLQIVEQDFDWLEYFKTQIPSAGNISLYKKDIVSTIIDYTANDRYSNLSDITQNTKYDLIIIDGPIAGKDFYSRTNVLDLIPENLAQDFVIIFDDAERCGEKNTADLIFKKLKENNIVYEAFYKTATKTQLVITSPKYKFLKFY